MGRLERGVCAAILIFGITVPFVIPDYTTQVSVLWVMILLSLTWDAQGGQMGYNSLGNIFFFGMGMYVSAVVQIGLVYDVGEYTAAFGGGVYDFTPSEYWTGLALGFLAAGVLSAIAAVVLGWVLIGLRGPYFAIGTLGVAIAAGELVGAWNWVGGGSGISMPTFPSPDPGDSKLAFYLATGVLSAIAAVVLGWALNGLRGIYFAIGTLGVAIAAGELVGAWDWIGSRSGISMPTFPSPDPGDSKFAFYLMNFALAVGLFAFLRWLYTTRFGLAINAIRDDEEKAEGMGLHTATYKRLCWGVSAFFLGISGAIFGNMIGFIEPLEVAFQTINFGIFMVLMALLGGKGTLWGPVIGAVVFHVIKEVTWTYMLGTQWVALGLLIILIVVFFQQGIAGWTMEKRPQWFGIRIDGRGREAAE